MIPDIVRKLQELLSEGITTEAQVVYLMVQTRKILEGTSTGAYQYLKFYCDWALHTKLSRNATAQEILNQFDVANVHLKNGLTLSDLPSGLRNEIDRISKLDLFKNELDAFLGEHSLGRIDTSADSWVKFLLLYARIIEDCALEIKATNSSASIESVTVKVALANRLEHGQMYYKISWIVLDKNGKFGEIFVSNSFDAS